LFGTLENEMREAIWNWTRAGLPAGSILPWWALAVRAVLYPLDFLFWRMSKARGYCWETDTWNIWGVTYSSEALHMLAKAQGETYRVTRTGEVVTLERVPNK
jgi:hypothetical protein